MARTYLYYKKKNIYNGGFEIKFISQNTVNKIVHVYV